MYDRIVADTGPDGRLPADFDLDPPGDLGGLPFAPGAWDALFGTRNKDGATVNEVVSLIARYAIREDADALQRLGGLLAAHHTIDLVDAVLDSLRADHRGIMPGDLITAAHRLATTSADIEVVKLAIALFGLFDLGTAAPIRDVVATLARYDDFTLYAVVATQRWTGGNDLRFGMARSARGWGKIRAVERLEPSTDEIRDWILREGCANGILDAYLGLVCATKGDLIGVLRRPELDADLFEAAGVIMEAMTDEGPAEGLSAYEHAGEALPCYLRHAAGHARTVTDLARVIALRQWAEEAETDDTPDIVALCRGIMDAPGWEPVILAAIRAGGPERYRAIRAARVLGLDVAATLMDAIRQDPLAYAYAALGLMDDPARAARLAGLYETVLPLEAIGCGMGTDVFAADHRQENQALEFVMQGLGAYPGTGRRLVVAGLRSPVIRARYLACRVLARWCDVLGRPLAAWAPDLADEVRRIRRTEVDADTRQFMRRLLDRTSGPWTPETD